VTEPAARARFLLAPGTYSCIVVTYYDGSGIRGVYGPYHGKATAEDAAKKLQAAGVYPHDAWEVMPLRLIDTGESGHG
jgi:cell division protein FtsN